MKYLILILSAFTLSACESLVEKAAKGADKAVETYCELDEGLRKEVRERVEEQCPLMSEEDG